MSTTPPPSRPRKPRYQVNVLRLRRLTPRVLRVTFGGAELGGFAWSGPAAHIKLIFDGAGPDAPPVARTYTPRRFDPRSLELDVDFVLHGEGPASTWAETAAPGQALKVAGPGRGYVIDGQADWYLLAGDDTAIPAIATILESLPPALPVVVLLELAAGTDAPALDATTPATLLRILTRGSATQPGRELETAVREWQAPPGSGRVYVGCESDAMRRIRRHLLLERGLAPHHITTRGYWKVGAVDHPDRDYGEDAG